MIPKRTRYIWFTGVTPGLGTQDAKRSANKNTINYKGEARVKGKKEQTTCVG